jgi:hypothetical protein
MSAITIEAQEKNGRRLRLAADDYFRLAHIGMIKHFGPTIRRYRDQRKTVCLHGILKKRPTIPLGLPEKRCPAA